MDKENPFPFCENKSKTIKQNLICEQHKMHNAMTENALPFVLFYVLTVLFIAFLFQLTKKNFDKGISAMLIILKHIETGKTWRKHNILKI